MLAVLEQAVADLHSSTASVCWGARAWFVADSNPRHHLFAFAEICREFGSDPAVVRARVFASVAKEGVLRPGLEDQIPGTSQDASMRRPTGTSLVAALTVRPDVFPSESREIVTTLACRCPLEE
jgi:hypothetical protein